MPNILHRMRHLLYQSIDSTVPRASSFFKTGEGDYAQHDQFIGVRVPTLRKIAKEFQAIALEDLLVCLQSRINEERLLALILLTKKYEQAAEAEKELIYLFYIENMRYVNNWNLVDSSAHLIMGAHLFKRDRRILTALAQSHDLWKRRIAIVATWYFIRQDDLECTFDIALLLQSDPHDLIHKAVGWMLREAGKRNEGALLQFLEQHQKSMPRTMLRYAIERLSQDQRNQFLAKPSLPKPLQPGIQHQSKISIRQGP